MSNQLCQACGNPDNHHERGGPTCIQKCERNRLNLEAAKLRERELQNEIVRYQHVTVAKIQQDRDAALSALEIARTAIETALRNTATYRNLCACYLCSSLRYTDDPSAALAERDRAIVARALAAIDLARGKEAIYATIYAHAIRREFNLEPKPEGE